MIEWTFNGVAVWLLDRSHLFLFYSVLCSVLLAKNASFFKSSFKNVLYAVSFVSFIVGVWEFPLFLFDVETGLIWVLNLIVYMLPLPIICILLKVKFSFGKKEAFMFLYWCIVAIFFSALASYLFVTDLVLWNWGFSFIFRITTFIFFTLIFGRMKIEK